MLILYYYQRLFYFSTFFRWPSRIPPLAIYVSMQLSKPNTSPYANIYIIHYLYILCNCKFFLFFILHLFILSYNNSTNFIYLKHIFHHVFLIQIFHITLCIRIRSIKFVFFAFNIIFASLKLILISFQYR